MATTRSIILSRFDDPETVYAGVLLAVGPEPDEFILERHMGWQLRAKQALFDSLPEEEWPNTEHLRDRVIKDELSLFIEWVTSKRFSGELD